MSKNEILAELTANNGAAYIRDDEMDFLALGSLVNEGKVEIGEHVDGETMVAFSESYAAEIRGSAPEI